MDENHVGKKVLDDLGVLAREKPESTLSMHQTAFAAFQPLVMV